MSKQRYVSTELTHFVGRSLKTPEKRYTLFKKIIQDRFLSFPPHTRGQRATPSFVSGKDITAGELEMKQIICFCDIPIADFPIHIKKYGPFGLSFSKDLLVRKGASPVFYVCKTSFLTTGAIIGTKPEHLERMAKGGDGLGLLFDSNANFIIELLSILIHFSGDKSRSGNIWRNLGGEESPIESIATRLLIHEIGLSPADVESLRQVFQKNNLLAEYVGYITTFLYMYVFGFTKGFSSTLSDSDKNNYYMEREWRLLCNVDFDLDDIERIILPRKFAKRFRKDFPDYAGQISFADVC